MIKSWAFEFFFASQEIQQLICGASANPDDPTCNQYAAKIVPYRFGHRAQRCLEAVVRARGVGDWRGGRCLS